MAMDDAGGAFVTAVKAHNRVFRQEHLRQAIESGSPHTYVSSLIGRDGILAFDAEKLHIDVLRQQGYEPCPVDVARSDFMNPSLRGAIAMLARLHVEDYRRVSAHLPANMVRGLPKVYRPE